MSNLAKNILRLPNVIQRVGLSRSNIYLKISKGLFPQPIPLGDRAVGWVESEIEAWIERQIKQSRDAKEKK